MKSAWHRDLLIGLFITIIIWGVVEIGLRIYVRQVVRPAHGVGLDPWELPDDELGWKLKAGYQNEETGLRINSQGFKGAEFLDKKGDVYRIAAMGSSTTFGRGAGYPQILQILLNESKSKDCHLRFEVINAGVEGYNSGQILRHFQRDVIPLKPDMILVYAGWNDIYGTDPQNRSNQVQPDSTFNRLLDYSFVLKAATKVVYDSILPGFEDTGPARQSVYATFVPDQFINNYNQIISLAQQHDIQVAGLTLPSLLGAEDAAQHEALFHYPHHTGDRQLLTALWRNYNRTILENLTSQNVPVIDLAQPIEAMSGESKYFFDTLHLYEKGYQIVATIILNDLVAQELLPCSTDR